jgi:hypothetical protein
MIRNPIGFPNPVNEVAARTVAAGVVVMAGVAISTRQLWLTIPIAYGFVARTLTGPRLSPLGFVATRFVAPRLGRWAKPVPGAPKRFAQAMGATFALGALVAWLVGSGIACVVVLAILIIPATLEAALAYCVGCRIFGVLMRVGIIPASICVECEDVWSRPVDPSGRPGELATG